MLRYFYFVNFAALLVLRYFYFVTFTSLLLLRYFYFVTLLRYFFLDCMTGWVGVVDGCVDRRVDWWEVKQWMDRETDRQMNESTDGRTDGLMD